MEEIKARQESLPFAVPQDPDLALVLLLIRKIAAGTASCGEIEAFAYQAFGHDYERPLTLARAYLIETCTAAKHPIAVIGKDHPRMTADEALMIEALVLCRSDLGAAEDCLIALTDQAEPFAPLAAARLLAGALADLGCLLGDTEGL